MSYDLLLLRIQFKLFYSLLIVEKYFANTPLTLNKNTEDYYFIKVTT